MSKRGKELLKSIQLNIIIDQIKLQGCAYEEDIMQLYSLGIPAYKLLENHTGKGIAELKGSIITSKIIIDSINSMGIYDIEQLSY